MKTEQQLTCALIAVCLVFGGCDRTPKSEAPSAETRSELSSSTPKASEKKRVNTSDDAPPSASNAPSAKAATSIVNPEATVAPSTGSGPSKGLELPRHAAPERLVAIGDLHGDLAATRDVLRLAGAIDTADRWVGKSLVVVQTGDQIDRGDEDREVLDLLERLTKEAEEQGGALHVLNGNHETMNAMGDFRYVTAKSFASFEGADPRSLPERFLRDRPKAMHPRAAALLPGGRYAKLLAQRPLVAIVGDSVFVHGGVLPEHLDYGLERLNREVSAWLMGGKPMPTRIASDDAPVWTRLYSVPAPSKAACETLAQVLARLDVKRMVVGHTIQDGGITSACDDKVFRIDVGMSRHYGGHKVAALEIANGQVRVLQAEKSK